MKDVGRPQRGTPDNMRNTRINSRKASCRRKERSSTDPSTPSISKHQVIKLGLDVDADSRLCLKTAI
jgi:hypothetical protein